MGQLQLNIQLDHNVSDEEMWFYIEDLKSKFSKIDHSKYVLAYSGGKDSERLRYLIKEVFGFHDIEIVAINTYMEHKEIKDRMYKHADVILFPTLKPKEIKEKYGSPCFTKSNDEYIGRYQRGSRAPSTLAYVHGDGVTKDGKKTAFKLPKKAKELLLNGKLHKISNKCCDYLKKKPMSKYLKSVAKTEIMGIISGESRVRDYKYTSCFTKKGKFVPTFDMTKEMADKIDDYFSIPIPKVYDHVVRTGCMGCPYGRHVEEELKLIKGNQRKFIIDYHKESYEIKGINIKGEC